jgi:hypothetical protein
MLQLLSSLRWQITARIFGRRRKSSKAYGAYGPMTNEC